MAKKYWRGGAPAFRQVVTLTFTGTWAAADTYRFTIGTKDLLLTIGAAVTVTDVATEFEAAFNADDPLDPLPSSGYVRSSGGQQILEFVEVAATRSGFVVTLTGALGVPFAYTSLATTAGSGDVTATTTIAATGPNHLDNPDNYLGGVAPVTGDQIIFDSGNIDCSHALNYLRTNSIECDITIFGNWKGTLGLPETNVAGTYPEYRERYLLWQTAPNTLEVLPASDGSIDQGNLYIDMQSCPGSTVRVLAARGSSQSPTIFFRGGDAAVPLASFRVERGSVHVEPPDAATTNAFFADGILIGAPGGQPTDCIVYFGSLARLCESSGSITQISGTVYSAAAMIIGADEAPLDIRGGVFHSQTQPSGSTPALQNATVARGATLFLDGECTIEDIDCAGTLDLRGGNAPIVFTGAVSLHEGASVYDPTGRGFSVFTPVSAGLQDLTLQSAMGGTWTRT